MSSSNRELWTDLRQLLVCELDAAESSQALPLRSALALLDLDLGDDPQRAAHWGLSHAGFDSCAEVRYQALLAAADVAGAIELLQRAADDERADPQLSAELEQRAALLELFCLDEPRAAAERLRDARNLLPEKHTWRGQLAELLAVASLSSSHPRDALSVLDGSADRRTSLLCAAHLRGDRLGRLPDAAESLTRAFALDDGDPLVLEWLIELASGDAPSAPERGELLQRKLELLCRQDTSSVDVLSVAFQLARVCLDQRDTGAASVLLDQIDAILTEFPDRREAWAEMLRLEARRELAAARGEVDRLGLTYLELAELSTVPAFERAYRLRGALLVWAARGDHPPLCEALARCVEQLPGDALARILLMHLRLSRGQRQELARELVRAIEAATRPPLALLSAAAQLAETSLGDAGLALSLRRDELAQHRDVLGDADVQRLLRATGATSRLVESYGRAADRTQDPARAGLWLATAGVLLLLEDQLDQAAARAREALTLHEEDLLASIVLYGCARRRGDTPALRRSLDQLGGLLVSNEGRARCLRELAALEPPDQAAELLARAEELQPGDERTLLAQAELEQRRGRPEEAVELLLHASQVAEDTDHQVEMLQRAAALLVQLGRPAHAREVLEHGVELSRSHELRLQLAELYEREGDDIALVALLEQRLAHERSEHQRTELLVRVAAAHRRLGDPSRAAEAYAEAFELAFNGEQALELLEATCSEAGRWDLLADTLGRLPASTELLNVRAHALEQLGRMQELVGVRTQLLGLATDADARAEHACELGGVYEATDQPDLARQHYERALEAHPGYRRAVVALQRLLGDGEQRAELLELLERQLESSRDDRQRVRVGLAIAEELQELGDRDRACEQLERLLAIAPDDADVLAALESLYARSSPLQLAALLELRAEAAVDAQLRTELHLRAATIFAEHHDLDRALQAHRQALLGTPANREAFTTYEALCIEHELWRELMQMYDLTITLEQEKGLRAYRLSDLYARRGHVQYQRLGQSGEAAASFLEAIRRDPSRDGEMACLAEIFEREEDWEGLVHALEQRANATPVDDELHLERLREAAALAARRLGARHATARRLWEDLHRLDPADQQTLEQLERIYRELGLPSELGSVLRTRISLSPPGEATLASWLELAELYEQELDDPARAAEAYENVLQQDQHHEQALRALARIYEATGNWARCIDVLGDLVIIEADPDERSLLYFKCGSISETRFHDEHRAIDLYRRSLEESPGCMPALHGLRELYMRGESWHDVLDTLQHELQLWEGEREQAGVLARIGEIYLEHLDQLDTAMEYFKDALVLDADCQRALLANFYYHYGRGEREQALGYAERLAPRLAREGDPLMRSRFYRRRAELLEQSGDLRSAADSLVIALELQPTDSEALTALTRLCRRAPDIENFATVFSRLEQLLRQEGEQRALAYVLVGIAALREADGVADEAISLYEEAIQLAPGAAEPVTALADLLLRLRSFERAEQELRALADSDVERPVRVRALLALGAAYGDIMQRPREAAEVYEELLTIDFGQREAAFRLAQERFAAGEPTVARELLERLVSTAPDAAVVDHSEQATYQSYLGAVLFQLGERSAATRAFRRSLQLDPACADGALALGRLLADAGDHEGAIQLLRDTLHEVQRRRDEEAELRIRWQLAAVCLAAGEASTALGEYEALADCPSATLEDRVAVADVCATELGDRQRALALLDDLIDSGQLAPLVIHWLARLVQHDGWNARSASALQTAALLGVASPADLSELRRMQHEQPWRPHRPLDDELQRELSLLPSDDEEHIELIEEVWLLLREPLAKLVNAQLPQGRPLDATPAPQLSEVAGRCSTLFDVKLAVRLADLEDIAAAAELRGERARLLVAPRALQLPTAQLAFAAGRCLGLCAMGYGLYAACRRRQLAAMRELTAALLDDRGERSQPRHLQFIKTILTQLPTPAAERLASLADRYRDEPLGAAAAHVDAWFARTEALGDRYGLIACDDIAAALRMKVDGDADFAIDPQGRIAIGAVAGGKELVQFFLSDDYLRLRQRLQSSARAMLA